MKSGVSVLDCDAGFGYLKKDLVQRYGNETAAHIWVNAWRILEELCERYKDLPQKVKRHTDGNMFRNAAVYMAI